jgi:hypothetical protein
MSDSFLAEGKLVNVNLSYQPIESRTNKTGMQPFSTRLKGHTEIEGPVPVREVHASNLMPFIIMIDDRESFQKDMEEIIPGGGGMYFWDKRLLRLLHEEGKRV